MNWKLYEPRKGHFKGLKFPIHEFFINAVYENDFKSDFHINTVIFRRV